MIFLFEYLPNYPLFCRTCCFPTSPGMDNIKPKVKIFWVCFLMLWCKVWNPVVRLVLYPVVPFVQCWLHVNIVNLETFSYKPSTSKPTYNNNNNNNIAFFPKQVVVLQRLLKVEFCTSISFGTLIHGRRNAYIVSYNMP